MSEQERQLRGVVRATSRRGGAQAKHFLGVIIEGSDGQAWVIDYDEQSPFHVFDNCEVVASGQSYEPSPFYPVLVAVRGERVRHFRVSTLRLVEEVADVQLREVGSRQKLFGRFDRGTSDASESTLCFVTTKGETLLVVNNPAGVTVGDDMEVWAYPVQKSSIRQGAVCYVWVTSARVQSRT